MFISGGVEPRLVFTGTRSVDAVYGEVMSGGDGHCRKRQSFHSQWE